MLIWQPKPKGFPSSPNITRIIVLFDRPSLTLDTDSGIKIMKRNFIIIIFCLVFLYAAYTAVEFLIPLPEGTKTKEVLIPKGATFRQAVDILAKENLIRDKNLFIFTGRLTGLHRKIRAGYYSITGAMNPLSVLMLLKNGQIVEYDITIVEGDSLLEIGEKLAETNIVDREGFEELSTEKSFLRAYNIDAPSIEGYIFPDTYKLPKGIEPENALGMMINSLREKYSDKLKERAAQLGLSEREVLTLASIIEKEAIINSERPLISAVYHNRLKKRMPLQADPTAVYGIKRSGERITMKDLKRKTPYNTYVIKGLPPGLSHLPASSQLLQRFILLMSLIFISYQTMTGLISFLLQRKSISRQWQHTGRKGRKINRWSKR